MCISVLYSCVRKTSTLMQVARSLTLILVTNQGSVFTKQAAQEVPQSLQALYR